MWPEECRSCLGVVAERVRAYIDNVFQALEQLEDSGLGEAVRRVVRLVRDYASDAQYYLEERGDPFTALADIAYAEGLLDALRWLGILDFEWKPLTSLLERPRVLVAGTFDIIHPGHIALLRHAWMKGRVHVIVARDATAERIKKRPAIVPEEQRLEVVRSIRYVSNAELGSTSDILEPVKRIKPDIILLGPDQWVDEEWLRRELEKHGLKARIERMREKHSCPLCSSTKIACKASETVPRHQCSSQGNNKYQASTTRQRDSEKRGERNKQEGDPPQHREEPP